MSLCLGRLPHNPERLARGLMAAPAPLPYRYQLDRSAVPFIPGLFGNDSLPDCTAVGVANSAIASGVIRSAEPVILDGKPQALYAQVIGQPDATPQQLATTQGAVAMDVLNQVATNGFDAGEQVPLVPVQSFPAHNTREVIAGLMCGQTVTAYLGIRLYARDMDQVGQGPWTASVADSGALEGGHVLLAWDYPVGLGDTDLVHLATWGMLQPCSVAWLMERLDETHGLEWPQLAPAPAA